MNKIIITIETTENQGQTVHVVNANNVNDVQSEQEDVQSEQIVQGWFPPEQVENVNGQFHNVIPAKVCLYTKKDGSKRYIKYVPLSYLMEHGLIQSVAPKKNKPKGSFYAWDFDRCGIRLLYNKSFSIIPNEQWDTKIFLPNGYFQDNGLSQDE